MLASLAIGALVGAASGTAAAAPTVDAKSRLLTASDLPAGWHAGRAARTRLNLAATPCLRGLTSAAPTASAWARTTFAAASGLPAFSEALAVATASWYDREVAALAGCRRLSLTVNSKRVTATLAQTGLPAPVASSHAFSLGLTATGVPIGAVIVLFRTEGLDGEAIYLTIGPPTVATAEAMVDVAVSKAEGLAVPPPKIISVVSSPVKVARTSLGSVGYREIGSGPPLLMIMGFEGTMETWDPRFVDALAHEHKVVIFDNAGIGPTRKPGASITIDEMADQASALIGTLGLRRPDVLGWSMGTMIAQALAVLHPTQVHQLVLCAGYPGTGTVEPTQTAIKDLTAGTPQEALADLFPANQHVAATGYELAIASWPASAAAPAAVVAAQEQAIRHWWSGADRAGKRTGAISASTLILDGAADRLDPKMNAHRLQALIHGSDLELYPDAGHAFLFQDEKAVVAKIESFLSS
jgi:pimeloyl-ACP methyl ester carboxylesterase